MNIYSMHENRVEVEVARRWLARRIAGLVLLGALQACGGGDAPTPLTAAPDAVTLGAGQSAALLANDRVGDAPASLGASGNALFTLTSAAPPALLGIAAGVLSVSADAVPGQYSFQYSLCEAASPSNCATAAVSVTIPAPVVAAVADSFALTPGSSADVLANDTLGGTQASAARVTVAVVGTAPAGITLSAAGLISVAPDAAPASYTVDYRICQAVFPINCATSAATVVVPAQASVSGRVIDAATALGIAGVRVMANGIVATTDAAGNYTLRGLAVSQRLTLLFSADGYADTARATSATAAGVTDVAARLVRVSMASLATAADANAGGQLTLSGSTASIIWPAASLQAAAGGALGAAVRVRLTAIDPSADSTLLPGDFTALINALISTLESFGAVDVSVVDDATGALVAVGGGQRLTIRIPVASRATSPPATAALYYFDPLVGRWMADGIATLANSGAGLYYEGTVSRLGTWSAAQIVESVGVTGCLVDASGARVAGGLIRADGIDYTSTSTAATDANGSFVIPVRKQAAAALVGQANGLASNTLRVGPYASDRQLGECLGLGQAGAGVTMKLTWGQLPSDLDSHLYAPDGSHIYFANRGALRAEPFANLDVDDTYRYGPEVVTITRLMVGSYVYAVNNYSGHSVGDFGASGARVEFTVPGRALELFTPPSTGELTTTAWWRVLAFDVDARCNVSVRRTNSFSGTEPSRAAARVPVYCTP